MLENQRKKDGNLKIKVGKSRINLKLEIEKNGLWISKTKVWNSKTKVWNSKT